MKRKPLWVITTYYNPAGYQTRSQNFHTFRRYLDVPLLVIELAEPGQHQLQNDDADILVKVLGNNLIWQKERLLNLAIDELPADVEFVAWVDCDVIFANQDWVRETQVILQSGRTFVQLFEKVSHLPQHILPEQISPESCKNVKALFSEQSFASSIVYGDYFDPDIRPGRTDMESGTVAPGSKLPIAHGVAWAGNRKELQEKGLYDACIIGGGDKAMALAIIGFSDKLITQRPMTTPQMNHYLNWAGQFESNQIEQIGFVSGTVFHLWHGRFARRNYVKRHEILKQLNFDPGIHLELTESGIWRWTQNATALESRVREYFFERSEDTL